MRFYSVHFQNEEGNRGAEYFANKRDARKAASEWRARAPADTPDHGAVVMEIDVVPTKAGILAALNKYAGHPNNG